MSTERTVPPAGAGPYIIATKQEHLDGWKPLSRRAVAEHYDVWDVVPAEARRHLVGMDPSGGTIGPLSDGTVIEVALTTDGELRAACPLILSSEWIRMSLRERCAAYNARQERS